MMKPSFLLAGLTVCVLGLTTSVTRAQSEFPTKAITMVVPFPAGGRTDVVGRIVAQELSKQLKKPVVVVNKPGAGGVLGAREVADAPANGYTLGFFSSAAVSAQYTVPTPISLSEFRLISIVNTDPAAVAVQWSSPWSTLKELIEAARKEPGKLRLGTIPGASAQIFAAGLTNGAGVNMIMVPFKGDSDGAIALAGNHIDVHVAVPVSYKSLSAAKKVRVLAVASETRSPFYGDLPTFKENGINLVIAAFHGVYAPKNTPQAVIDKLANAIERSMQSKEVQSNMENVGAGLASMRGAEAEDFLHKQDKTYRDIIEKLDLHVRASN
jgi:tripartite-type tricarboxylate transporter receptor subunit TctC